MAAPAPRWPDVVDTQELQGKIKNTKVLAVGAGGIGCELLKTLVLTGFEDIEVIDLDTIETSNLNRQFLFRKHHVGKSKAEVAAQVVRSFAPNARVVAHQANIKEARFGLEFFKSKDIVLNGLDNLDARRHVNRLCLAAGTSLVESGTAGHKGQVTVHLKGVTECYECTHRGTQQKSYPICTLRNTPDKPIHCVVWAKEMLYARLFGRSDAVTDLDEQSNGQKQQPQHDANANGDDAEQRQQDQRAAEEAAAEAAEAASFFLRREGEGAFEYARRVFERVFTTDIERVVGMEDLWKLRKPPVPLRLEQLLPDEQEAHQVITAAAAASNGIGSVARALGLGDHQAWSDAGAARVFLAAVVAMLEHRQDDVGRAVFDKDDAVAVDFVTAASNLRSSSYSIPLQSSFDAKGMAGNIIHAIATTNAIVSGLLVTEAIKVLAGALPECRTSFLFERTNWTGRKKAPKGLLIGTIPSPPPRPGCVVCGKAQLHLSINTATTTLAQLLDKVVRRALALNEPMLMCGGFMYEEGEGLEEDEVVEHAAKLPKAMKDLPGGGLGHGAVMSVMDQSQGGFNVEVIINHRESFDEEQHPDGFILEGELPTQEQQQQEQQQKQQNGAGAEAAEGAAAAAAAAAVGQKRAREDDGDQAGKAAPAVAAAAEGGDAAEGHAERDSKKAKVGGGGAGSGKCAGAAVDADDDVIVLDDDSDSVL